MNEMSILPVQFTRMILTFGGICIRLVPAKSAPAYEHQLQQKDSICGSKSPDFLDFFLDLGLPVDFGVIVDKDRASSDESASIVHCY